MTGCYQRYVKLLQRIAQRRLLPLWVGRVLCLLAFAVATWQLLRQGVSAQLLFPLLLALWLLLYLLICAGFAAIAPQSKGQRIRDKLRAFMFGLRLHSLALATLLLLAISLYATVKLLSVVARTLV